MTATLGAITKHTGVAGQIAYSVPVTYDDEPTRVLTFVGTTYGGPIVMITPSTDKRKRDHQTFVTDPSRFGTFGPDWVRAFFA